MSVLVELALNLVKTPDSVLFVLALSFPVLAFSRSRGLAFSLFEFSSQRFLLPRSFAASSALPLPGVNSSFACFGSISGNNDTTLQG